MAFAIVSRLGGAIGLLPLITKTRFAMHQAPVGANRYKSAWAMSTNIAPLAPTATFIARGRQASGRVWM
jgi:hypothetical protein